ncbi:hypothetical protein TDB9533_04591 [Thalassocella blandensis]|nr:hypothetical protein TDB9533_04591 [Thalassocella blandensis]
MSIRTSYSGANGVTPKTVDKGTASKEVESSNSKSSGIQTSGNSNVKSDEGSSFNCARNSAAPRKSYSSGEGGFKQPNTINALDTKPSPFSGEITGLDAGLQNGLAVQDFLKEIETAADQFTAVLEQLNSNNQSFEEVVNSMTAALMKIDENLNKKFA